jgi:hypothetical protein
VAGYFSYRDQLKLLAGFVRPVNSSRVLLTSPQIRHPIHVRKYEIRKEDKVSNSSNIPYYLGSDRYSMRSTYLPGEVQYPRGALALCMKDKLAGALEDKTSGLEGYGGCRLG